MENFTIEPEKIWQWASSDGLKLFIGFLLLIFALKFYNFLIGKFMRGYYLRSALKHSDGEKISVEKRVNTLQGILRQIGKIVILLIFLLIFLDHIGINIGPILASAGILGLAIGFGAQELVRDAISGFFNLMENNIRVGDVVTLNDTSGVVESISLRTTQLRDPTGTVHVFQNGKINSLSNQTKEWSAMIFDIGVAYDSNLQEVMKIMQKVADEMQADPKCKDLIIAPLEIMGLNNFGDSSIEIRARLKTIPGEQWAIGRIYRLKLKEAFDANGIEIPFPQRTLHLVQPLK